MKKSNLGGTLLILSATLIWGVGVVALTAGMDYMGPFTLSSVRFLLGGSCALGPALYFAKRNPGTPGRAGLQSAVFGLQTDQPEKTESKKHFFWSCVFCGLVLCTGASLRQFALLYTSVGRVTFITSLFVIIVPLVGLFFGRRVSKKVWFGVLVSLVGMYFLGFSGGVNFNLGDILAFICAFVFALHILLINRFSKVKNILALASIQAFTVGILSLVLALIFESPSFSAIFEGLRYVLYAGIMSSFVAHIMQIRAQKTTDPAIASILFSMEAVFATITGWLVLNQFLTVREIIGCALLFVAVVLAKLPLPERRRL